MDSLIKFLECDQANRRWINSGPLTVYVRKGRHCLIPRRLYLCLDIASVAVQEADRGQGVFTRWLDGAADIVGGQTRIEALFVENVMSDRFLSFFEKNGWKDAVNAPRSVYKISKHI
jgi:hypothetical protein